MAAAPLFVAQAGLLVTFDLAAHPWVTVAWLAAGFCGLVWAAARIAKDPQSSMAGILLVAAALRLLALPLPPTLSDDVYRYVWDGRVAGAGLNPYLVAPEDPELEPLRDGLYDRLAHREVETVYPPLAVSVFALAARFPAPVLVLKTILTAADLAVCYLLVLVARKLSVPVGRVVWYAWSPLPVLEIAGMGHVDALGVLAVAVVVLWLSGRPKRVTGAAVAAGAAILAKVVPLLALPVWARSSGRPLVFLAVALAVAAISFAPVVHSVGGIPPGYLTYGVSWEFNGPLFEPLWRLIDRLEITAWIEGVLDALKERQGGHDRWNRLYPFNYPQLLAKIVLGVLAAGSIALLTWRSRPGRVAPLTGAVFGTIILCSATVYPWYLLWVLPWAAISRQPAWLLLSALVPLSYLPQFTGAPLMPWVYLAIWAPFGLMFLRSRRWSTG